MGQYLERNMLRLLVSAFQLNTGTVLTRSRWILNLEKQRCAWSKTLHKYFFICTHTDTHTHAHTILSVPPSRHNHTQADNSVSQGALSLTLWPPPDRGSSWTGTHGCLELASPGELEGEESLSASENDQLSFHGSVCECAVMSPRPRKVWAGWVGLWNVQQCRAFCGSQQADEKYDITTSLVFPFGQISVKLLLSLSHCPLL